MDSLVIKRRRSPHRLLIYITLIVLLAVLLLGSAGLFAVYPWQNGSWGIKLQWLLIQGLSPEELISENTELREKLLILEQNRQVDIQAAALLQERLIASHEEIFQLRKDLEFYQGIISATGEADSPGVYGMRVKRLTHANGYRLELILLNIANSDKTIEGEIDVVLEGILDSKVKRLSVSDISLDENLVYTVSFKNFQRFENNFILPENFKPQRVFVTLSVGDRKNPGFEKVFDWPVGEGGAANVG